MLTYTHIHTHTHRHTHTHTHTHTHIHTDTSAYRVALQFYWTRLITVPKWLQPKNGQRVWRNGKWTVTKLSMILMWFDEMVLRFAIRRNDLRSPLIISTSGFASRFASWVTEDQVYTRTFLGLWSTLLVSGKFILFLFFGQYMMVKFAGKVTLYSFIVQKFVCTLRWSPPNPWFQPKESDMITYWFLCFLSW